MAWQLCIWVGAVLIYKQMGNELSKIESFRAELAKAETFEEISFIKSQADAVAEFAKRLKLSKEKQDEIGMFRIQVEAEQGKWLEEHFPTGVRSDRKSRVASVATVNSMKDIGINEHQSSQSRLINKEPDLVQEAIEEIKKDNKQVVTPNAVQKKVRQKLREQNIEKQKEEIENNKLPEINGLYDIISIDPPWNYGRKYDPDGSRVANPYPEMSNDDIKKIKLPLNYNAVVFLWTTHKFLPIAFEILNHWQLDYKATMVWDKVNIGMGNWFRMQCEFCLVGIKNKPFWNNTKFSELIKEKRREHSRKPDSFFNLINEICAGRKLEYFSREKRDGWDVFGNDVNKF
jgi:N6-adenosine-specific RNA methylase IME4